MKTLHDYREALRGIKQDIKKADYQKAFRELCTLADPDADYSVQHRYAKILQNIPAEKLSLTPVRIGIVATTTMDQFVDVFRFYLTLMGLEPTFHVARFNTLHQTVLDPQDSLYSFKPDIVWLFTSHRDVMFEISPGAGLQEVEQSIVAALSRFQVLWDALKANSSAIIVQNNADLPMERLFGNYSGNTLWSRSGLLQRFNIAMAAAASSEAGLTIFDLDHISSIFGKSRWQDESYWYNSKHGFSLDAIGITAYRAASLVRGIKGLSKKCLILDLDNTLWGGVIGDDGVEGIHLGNGSADGEAFMDFQAYLKSLKERGVILAVCSKNQEENARIPFEQHAEMRLKLEDIAVFVANWNNKADNIRQIADTLEIGLDSMVFIDDNPVERELVRSMLPMVETPELPKDPSLYLRTLDSLALFETISFSVEDKTRGEMYRHNAERKQLKNNFSNISEFLKDLKMVAAMGDVNTMTLPRCAQLINKSNQFHPTTTRYSEAQIREMVADDTYICRYYYLRDRFGDNGLISVVLMKRQDRVMQVDTWVMSCRVLARGMEEFVHNDMVSIARDKGCVRLEGKFIPSAKNKLVAKLYPRLGYKPAQTDGEIQLWQLPIDDNTPLLDNNIRAENQTQPNNQEP
ncbi:MAG: HAD family hydrolase [Magnetococcales bacterium]|nr:HAD family hydrolase [Magnetococcales bacterium]